MKRCAGKFIRIQGEIITSFINKKNLFIAVATFIVGTFAVGSFFGFSLIHTQSIVGGKITNVLLDREGRANGMILDSGLQINFSPETGGAIFAVARISDGRCRNENQLRAGFSRQTINR